MFNKISVLLFITIFLAPPMLAGAEGIRVCGRVRNKLYPLKGIDDVVVIIETPDVTLEADYNERSCWYQKFLTMSYRNKKISVKSLHENYVQVKPIEFTPDEPGRYENGLLLIHKKNLAEEKLTEAKQCREEGSLDKAIELVNEAIWLSPQPKAYIMKVQLIHQMLRTDVSVLPELLRFGEDVKHDEHFQEFSPSFRHNFYLQTGSALAHPTRLKENEQVDITTTYYDLAVGAFDEAITLASKDARAYQGKYVVQSIPGFYSDMIFTIKQFFEQNPNVTNEKVVKQFLTDWTTGVEKLTGYPKETEQKYLESLRQEPKYQAEWNDLLTILSKYERFYREGDTPLDRRLRKAKLQAEKFLGANL